MQQCISGSTMCIFSTNDDAFENSGDCDIDEGDGDDGDDPLVGDVGIPNKLYIEVIYQCFRKYMHFWGGGGSVMVGGCCGGMWRGNLTVNLSSG